MDVSTGPDAELISLCGALLDIHKTIEAAHAEAASSDTYDKAFYAALDSVYEKRECIFSSVENIGAIHSLEGAKAFARMALAHVAEDFCPELSLELLAKSLIGDAASS